MEIFFRLLAELGRLIGRILFGRMPNKEHLTFIQLAKLKEFNKLDISPNQLWVWLAAAAPMVIGVVLLIIVQEDRWKIVLPLCALAAIFMTPIVAAINYKYERRRKLRNLGRLERLSCCPVCDSNISHTEADACPERGEPIAPYLNVETEQLSNRESEDAKP